MTSAAARSPLPDAAARNMVTASLGTTLFVEAGAGSGKTSSLVSRIVNLVASGVAVGRIAAITFTDAAARELRTRVRDELERRGLDEGDRHLVNAAGQVESAAFTTLHGFALRLLADHPVEAGLPPGFGVADEIGSMLEFDENWRQFAGQIGDDLDLLDLQERAAVLGVELRRFADIARRFDDNWDLLERVDASPAPLSRLDFSDTLGSIAALGSLVDACLDPRDLLAEGLLDLVAAAEDCARLDPLGQLEWLDNPPWPRRKAGRKANWVRMEVDEARQAVDAARSATEVAVNRFRIEIIDHFVARIAGFVEQRVEARQASGELAYHDLLVLARRLLRSSPLVREQLHQRYSRILLDEFQDTDPIQIELAVLLAANGDVRDRHWSDLATELEPGRLVVVGDPKQSIYRFRRADIGIYAEAEEALVDEASLLTSNFRSVPGVVEWVNEFFGRAIGDGEPGAQPRYTPLAAIREPDPELDVPVLAIGQAHDRSVSVGEIRGFEAADVAAVICRAVEEGWRTERDGQWLPLRLQDIAVLIPSRLSLPALEAAFGTANLPFRPETSSLVYATQEVRDVLAGVRAVVDPSNSVDVVAALRSGLFALGDDDLLSWHLADGSWNYERIELVDGLVDHPVAEAFAVLSTWHRDRWWIDPSALIERIVRERRLREAALAEPRPRDRWRRYRFLTEQAREFTATKGGDLHDFVAWVEIQSSDLARVTEPIPAEPDDDAVRVLTIHGSKGLEFPMVVLAGAPTREATRVSGAQVLFPAGSSPQIKLSKGKTTELFDVHASVEEVLDGYERVRLHYVAATRARDLLVVSAHHKEGIQSSGRRTWDGLQECPDRWRPFERRGNERYRIEPPTQLRLAGGSQRELESIWMVEQDRLLRRSAQVRTVSATGLVEELKAAPRGLPDLGERSNRDAGVGAEIAVAAEVSGVASTAPDARQEVGDPGEELRPWRRGRAGSAIGSAVHATLQAVDLVEPVGVERLAALNAEREGVAGDSAEVAALVHSALGSTAVGLTRHHRFWRELYVAAPVGDALVEGFIDLCIDGPDGLLVVDYKTDVVGSADEIDRKLDDYRIQAATYAVALEHIVKRPVVECRFVFVSVDGVVERTLSDLAQSMAEIREHLAVQPIH